MHSAQFLCISRSIHGSPNQPFEARDGRILFQMFLPLHHQYVVGQEGSGTVRSRRAPGRNDDDDVVSPWDRVDDQNVDDDLDLSVPIPDR